MCRLRNTHQQGERLPSQSNTPSIKTMNIKHLSVAAIAGISMLFTSCVVGPYDSYGTFTYSTDGHNSSVAWTSASYDTNGFPIYGYYYGRPVYGYTSTGAAIFTIAALTAYCFVPDWGPAPWYHGHWHYPHHIHRVAVPPHYAHGHHPHQRPHHHSHARPATPHHARPHANHARPATPHHARPQVNHARPQVNHSRPTGFQARPQSNRVSGATRPAGFSHHRHKQAPQGGFRGRH